MSAPLGRLHLPWVDLPLFGLLLACAPVCALPDLPEQVGLGPGGASLLERAALPQVLGLAQGDQAARKQRIVARENAKARKRRTHLIIRLGGILSNEGVLGYDEGVWNDEGNRQRLLDMLKAHAAELRAWASDAGVRLPSAESAGELREQVRDLPQEPQIQEQPGYGYQPGFQQPQQWQQQPWN